MSAPLKNAAQGIIDVQFSPAASELKVLVRLDPNRFFYVVLTLLSRIGAFALTAALTGAALWASGSFAQDFLESLTLSIAGGLAGIVAFRLIVEKSWRQRIRKALCDQTRDLRVIGDGEALTIEDEHVSSRFALSGIDRLIASSTHLVLFQDRRAILALPRAAFDPPEMFEAFVAYMQGRVSAHQTHQPISEKTP